MKEDGTQKGGQEGRNLAAWGKICPGLQGLPSVGAPNLKVMDIIWSNYSDLSKTNPLLQKPHLCLCHHLDFACVARLVWRSVPSDAFHHSDTSLTSQFKKKKKSPSNHFIFISIIPAEKKAGKLSDSLISLSSHLPLRRAVCEGDASRPSLLTHC